MHLYAVGSPYHEGQRTWPETPHLRIAADGLVEFVLFMASPTDAEITAVRHSELEFAWVDGRYLSFLVYRFNPGIPWSDCPYSTYFAQRAGTGGDPPASAEAGLHQVVHVILVDAATGIIKAMRMTTWPPDFVGHVAASMRRMREVPFTQLAHDRELNAFYQTYTPEQMLARAGARCVGGQKNPE